MPHLWKRLKSYIRLTICEGYVYDVIKVQRCRMQKSLLQRKVLEKLVKLNKVYLFRRMNCIAALYRDARNNLVLQTGGPLLSDETGSVCFCQNF